MSRLKTIIEEREKAIANLQAAGKPVDDVDNLLLLILRTLNSGEIEGTFSFRINQHTIKDPIIETRIHLKSVAVRLDDGEPVIQI